MTDFEKFICVTGIRRGILSILYKVFEVRDILNDSIRQYWGRDCGEEIQIPEWEELI